MRLILCVAILAVSIFALADPSTGRTTRAADGQSFTIDAGHSAILFRVQHKGAGMFYGRFNAMSGTIHLDRENIGASSVKMEIDAGSVDTNDAKRDQHLTSPDFFNAKQFPRATFESTSVSGSEDLLEVVGDFTLRGVTKSVTVPMHRVGESTDSRGGHLIGFEGQFEIDRMDFGVNYGEGSLGETVRLIISVEAREES